MCRATLRSAPQRVVARSDRLRGWLRRTRRLALVLIACCSAAPPLAYASPPDPVWIPGIYDVADDDDVIGMLTDATALEGPPRATVEPVSFVYWQLSRHTVPVLANSPLSGHRPRSPPTI